jgi:AraC family transcriptional regulator, regulatory protein of adaptative response / methylated-DNA-[protein]-cysteine methyltransferase
MTDLVRSQDAYAKVAAAIRHLVAHHDEQPRLEEVARAVGLGPHHFQRLFSRWAGVSPKRFLALVTLDHAKALLEHEASVLEAALEVGLSGPSRLHDLFVTVEAMTPGDYRREGAGLVLRHGIHPTPLGPAFFLVSDRGLAGLAFVDDDPEEALAEAEAAWPLSRLVHDPEGTRRIAERCFATSAGAPTGEPLPLLLRGTNFQLQVWSALLRIPEGRVVTYGGLARALGRPDAARAVGAAAGRNRIGVLVPCHRMIRESGALAGYRWGHTRKRALLALEALRAEAPAEPVARAVPA